MGTLSIGLVLIGTSRAMLVYARPRDGIPKSFLRSENTASPYTLALIGLFVFGVALMFVGMTS